MFMEVNDLVGTEFVMTWQCQQLMTEEQREELVSHCLFHDKLWVDQKNPQCQ